MTSFLGYRSYAKINLYLDVLERREDGYHNIETVFQTVDLSDTLHFSERRSRVTLSCASKDIDAGEDNLAHQAAALLKRECQYKQGVRIELEKGIPVAAGLAGGSGNAAATLVALNRLWNLGLSKARLQELAIELGSDVPFCLLGGTAMGAGRGEILTRLKPLKGAWFVLVHPAITVSTSRAFSHPDLARRKRAPKNSPTPALERAVEAFKQGDFSKGIFNRFEATVFDEHPRLEEYKKQLLDAGCLAAAMSGTGSTLFGICKTKKDAQAVSAEFEGVHTSIARRIASGVEPMD